MTIDKFDLKDINITINITNGKYEFFLNTHGIFMKIYHIESPNQAQWI